MRTRFLALVPLAAIALALTGAIAPAAQAAPAATSYIVTVAKGSEQSVQARAKALGGELGFVYTTVLNGFSVRLPAAAADALSRTAGVTSVVADSVVSIDATQSPATWGIDRVDQTALPLSNSYTYNFTGAGVRAYIIDTGINAAHTEFGGRVVAGYTAISDGNGTNDCNGHGTHVAGTVGGATYGIAKGVTLVPVRVLGCNGSGSTSGVIAGVDWAAADAAGRLAVANMSLGGGAYSPLDTAVNNAVTNGVVMAVAAGNSNADACQSSPARAASALTVGATTSTDARASYSNFGTCLDLFAPGSSITSAWYTSTTATNTISGTSMATPHVAGVAALVREANPSFTAAQTSSAVVAATTSGVVTSAGTGSPNRLLYSLVGGGGSGGGGSTPTKTEPGQISSVTAATGNSRGSITARWSAPTNGGGTISGYQVKVYAASNNALVKSGTVTTTSVSVSGLTSGALYYVTVAATNEVGTQPVATTSNTVKAK